MGSFGVFPFYNDEDKLECVHVAPCTEDGEMKKPHIHSPLCLCDPEVERLDGAPPIYIHRTEQ